MIQISEKLFTFPSVRQSSYSPERTLPRDIKYNEQSTRWVDKYPVTKQPDEETVERFLPPIHNSKQLEIKHNNERFRNGSSTGDLIDNGSSHENQQTSYKCDNRVEMKIYTISPPLDTNGVHTKRTENSNRTKQYHVISESKMTSQMTAQEDDEDVRSLNECLRISPFPKLHEEMKYLFYKNDDEDDKIVPRRKTRKKDKKAKAKRKIKHFRRAREHSMVRYTPPKRSLESISDDDNTFRRKNRQVLESFRYSYAIDELINKQSQSSVSQRAHISKIEIDHMGREIRTMGPSVLNLNSKSERSSSILTSTTKGQSLGGSKYSRGKFYSGNELRTVSSSLPSPLINGSMIFAAQQRGRGILPNLRNGGKISREFKPRSTNLLQVFG